MSDAGLKHKALFDAIYLSNEGKRGSFGSALRLYQAAKRVNSSVKKSEVVEYLKSVPGYSKNQRVLRKFKKRSFLALWPNENLQVDVAYLSSMKTITSQSVHNRPNYILCVFDVYTKRGYAEPMNRKRPIDCLKAFKAILARWKLSPPNLIQTDAGSEFFGAWAAWCRENKVLLYSSTTFVKAALAENFIGQLKRILSRMLSHYQTNDWAKLLPQALSIYNSEPSSGLPSNMSPYMAELPENMPELQEYYLEKRAESASRELKRHPRARFAVGDKVRHILFSKDGSSSLNKGVQQKFSNWVFTVQKVTNTTPRGYYIGLYKNGRPHFFYAEELRLAVSPDFEEPRALMIRDSRAKILSTLRSGKARATETEFLTLVTVPKIDGAKTTSELKWLTKKDLFKYKDGPQCFETFALKSSQDGVGHLHSSHLGTGPV